MTRSFYSHFPGTFGFTYSPLRVFQVMLTHNPLNFRGFNRQFIVCLLISNSNKTLKKYNICTAEILVLGIVAISCVYLSYVVVSPQIR